MAYYIDVEKGLAIKDGRAIKLDTATLSDFRAVAVLDDGTVKGETLSGANAKLPRELGAVKFIVDEYERLKLEEDRLPPPEPEPPILEQRLAQLEARVTELENKKGTSNVK